MKDRIIDVSRNLVLRYGVRGFTVDDICSQLGISKKTIYKHFQSKDEIISVIIDQHIHKDKECTLERIALEKNLRDKLKAVLLNYYEYTIPLFVIDELRKSFPDEWKKIDSLFLFKQELFRQLISEGIAAGIIRRNIDIDVLMLMIHSTIKGLMDFDFLSKHDLQVMTVNRLIEKLESIIFHGICVTDQ
ncbi:MAG: TetR/AcrR family transcriptional regulator [Bacillota bacterium]